MNKLLITYSLVLIFFTANCFGQNEGEKKGWPSADRNEFISSCIKTAKTSMSEDSARFYCYCMQEKIEKKFPTVEAASKMTNADLESPEWKKEIQNCLNSNTRWASKDRSDFLVDCVKSAKEGGLSEQKANSYCECMLFKIEKIYPNPADAVLLTEEKLKSPEWKKIIQTCFDF